MLKNNLLSFKSTYVHNTSEIYPFQIAKYKNLVFKIFEKTDRITLEGSFHKYWNNGQHNYNDFRITDLEKVISNLESDFQIKAENCSITQLEIGVNLSIEESPLKIINNTFLHSTVEFKNTTIKGKGHYKLAEHQRYSIKIYDKSTQYKNQGFEINKNILRFEIKYKNFQDVRTKFKIKTLRDLLDFGLNKLKEELAKEWEKVLFVETNNLGINHKYSNPLFWNNLKYQNFKYHRRKLNILSNSKKSEIKFFINNKVKQLST